LPNPTSIARSRRSARRSARPRCWRCGAHPGDQSGLHVDTVEEFIDERNPPALIPACDAVIDAIDQVRAKAALIAHCRRAGIRIVTTGGAGGRTDPTRSRCIDLSRTTQDALASKVRARLRKEYGFTRDPKKKFGVDCVFRRSRFAVAPAPTLRAPAATDAAAGLNCAGYGSSVAVTAVSVSPRRRGCSPVYSGMSTVPAPPSSWSPAPPVASAPRSRARCTRPGPAWRSTIAPRRPKRTGWPRS
jgi:hypothetical protein